MIYSGCPGSSKFKTPTIEEKVCPDCGSLIEIFSVDTAVKCDNCGFVAYNNIQSCVSWCKYARQCVGDELYEQLMAQKDAPAEEAV